MKNKEKLLKKIKKLADDGVGGEKDNAQKIMQEMKQKYNIKEEDIEESVDKEIDITVPAIYKEQYPEEIKQSKPKQNFFKKIWTFFKKVWNYFSTYEKIWFFSIVVLSIVFAFVFPEEETNGVNGTIIMILYLVDIFSNVLCELLISKQSKWNFIVSLVVEITEIATLIILAARFATMAVTIFFWIPIDIISFINWNNHTDKDEKDLTVVRKLKGWQSALVIVGIVAWTVGIGYLMAAFAPETDFYSSDLIEKVVCYLDACASAVGIANGLFILFRFREQWIAWYICAALETAMNILCGQYVLLVLKAGYFTNTTYGYIKWSKYCKQHATTTNQNQITQTSAKV